MMYIPLIQGALCYAFKVGGLGEGEKSQAEAAVFAASVLPHVHAANEVAGEIIYKNMKVGATSVSFDHVKAAFESVYSDMGISCADVGGLWNDATGAYYEGMEPCDDGAADSSTPTNMLKERKQLIALLFLYSLKLIMLW